MKTKFVLFALVLALSVLVFAGCQQPVPATSEPNAASAEPSQAVEPSEDSAQEQPSIAEPDTQPVRVFTLMGPTGMGMAKLIDDDSNGDAKLNYQFTIASAPDQISAEVIKGDFEIAAVPVNLAAVLFKKTEGNVKVAGINTLGVLYILENGSEISSVSDLKGKTLYATGQGATPEYILKYILSKNGVDPEKDLTIEYLAEHSELATRMVSGDVKLGMLPEPNVTNVLLNNADAHIALNLTEEWKKVSETDLVQGCIIVSKDFADNRPDALRTFLEEYEASVKYVTGNVDEAAALIEKAGIIPKAAVAKKALPNCNIVLVTGEAMKAQMAGMLNVLFEAAPSSVGGALPGDEFYYLGS